MTEAEKLEKRIDKLVDHANIDYRTKIDVLYKCLDVLDSKAASLLTFNAILAAVFALLLEEWFRGTASPKVWETANLVGLALTLASAWSCLLIALIEWRFLEKLGEPSNNWVPAFANEITHLAQEVERRTVRHGLALALSFGALVALIFALVAKKAF